MTMKLPISENVEEKMTTVIADDLQIKGTITFKTSLIRRHPDWLADSRSRILRQS